MWRGGSKFRKLIYNNALKLGNQNLKSLDNRLDNGLFINSRNYSRLNKIQFGTI